MLEDGLLVFGQFLFFVWVSLDTFAMSKGFMDGDASYYDKDITSHVRGGDSEKILVLKVIYGSSVPYYICIWAIKFALVTFFYQFIQKGTTHRLCLNIITTLLIISLVIIICVNLLLCQPVALNWSLNLTDKCDSSTSATPFIFSSISNIVTDIMVFIIPFPIIPKMKDLTRSQKYGLIATFSLGAITITVCIVRVIFIAISAKIAVSALLTAVECGTAMIVACLPAMRLIYSDKAPKVMNKLRRKEREPVDEEQGDIAYVGHKTEESDSDFLEYPKHAQDVNVIVQDMNYMYVNDPRMENQYYHGNHMSYQHDYYMANFHHPQVADPRYMNPNMRPGREYWL